MMVIHANISYSMRKASSWASLHSPTSVQVLISRLSNLRVGEQPGLEE